MRRRELGWAAFSLLIWCFHPSAPMAQSAPGVDAATRQQVIERAANELNARYVFPDIAQRAGEELRRQQSSGAFDALADGEEFAARLTAVLQSVTNDKHLRVRYSPRPAPADSTQPSAAQIAEQRAMAERQNFGVEKVERLPGNIGYLELRGFARAEWAANTIAAALQVLANTDALIIDLRRNGGGDPATVAFVSSYLFDGRTHLNSLYWREGDRTDQFWTHDWVPGQRFGQKRPVYVLTSNRTFSGAEEFSYNLKALKRATIVGETTGGGAHPGAVRRLAPHFSMFVPTGRAINPITGTNWEGSGVSPDVAVPAADALRVAQTMALKPIIAAQTEEPMAAALRKRLSELEASR